MNRFRFSSVSVWWTRSAAGCCWKSALLSRYFRPKMTWTWLYILLYMTYHILIVHRPRHEEDGVPSLSQRLYKVIRSYKRSWSGPKTWQSAVFLTRLIGSSREQHDGSQHLSLNRGSGLIETFLLLNWFIPVNNNNFNKGINQLNTGCKIKIS